MEPWMIGMGMAVLLRLGRHRRQRASDTAELTPGQQVQNLSSSAFDATADVVSAVGRGAGRLGRGTISAVGYGATIAASQVVDAAGRIVGAAGGEVIRLTGPVVGRPTGLIVDGSTEIVAAALVIPRRVLRSRRQDGTTPAYAISPAAVTETPATTAPATPDSPSAPTTESAPPATTTRAATESAPVTTTRGATESTPADTNGNGTGGVGAKRGTKGAAGARRALPTGNRGHEVHVLPGLNGGWAVRRNGADRASSVHRTQAAAVTRGRELARRAKVDLVVHGHDGKVETSDAPA